MSASGRSGRRRRDRGFTLVELVIALVLGGIVIAVTTSAMLTSMNAADSTVKQIEDSTDATLVSAYLIRDAQAAGGVDPSTGTQASDVGVSIAATTAGWQGCGQTGTLVVRFSWYDRQQATSATPVVVTYALKTDGSLTRRVCERGTTVDVVIGSHVSSASVACTPVANCTGTPKTVAMTVTGSDARSPFTYTLTASLRGSTQATPTSTNSAPVPLMALGDSTSVCPNLTIAQTGDGLGTVTVIGDAIVGDDCGSSPVAGDQTKLQPTGATSLVPSLADPYATLTAPSATCPSTGTNPAIGSASTTGITVYPQAVTIHELEVVDFLPGIHVFCHGITVDGGAIVSGTDVLWYVLGGDVSVRREAQIELAAPTTGAQPGVVVWDAVTGGAVSIDSQGQVPTLRGVVYAPRSEVAFSGVAPIVVGGVIARSIGTATSSSIRLGMPIPYLAISPNTVPAAQQGVAYGPLTMTATGGTGTLTWVATGLPAGMTLSTDGILSGNPTELGTFEVNVVVTDSTAAARSTTYLIDVRPQLVVTGPTSLATGQRGVAHPGATGAASGGLPPYAWSATGLPDGMIVSEAGVLSGTPTQSGTFSVVLTVRDSGGGAASTTLPLTISAAIAVSTPSLPAGTTGTVYTSTTLAATGGTTPYTWSATGLPPGLALSTGGVLSGTPTAGGTYGITVTATDAAGTHASRTYSVQITAATTAIVPMGAAQGFQVLTEQAASMSTSGVQGAVAVGGNLTFGSTQTFGSGGTSTFRPASTGSYTTLAVGGYVVFDPTMASVLTIASGFLHTGATTGAAIVTDSAQAYLVPASNPVATATPRVQVSGQSSQTTSPIVASPAFPFSTAFAQFRARSAELAVLGPSSCSSIATASLSSTGVLTLTSGKVNVWNTTVAQLSAITALTTSVAISATTPLVINVTDAGSLTLPSTAWTGFTGATKSALLWNFPTATALGVSGTFSGTLYAPSAAVTLTNIALTGDVVAASLSVGSGSLSLAHFAATIPCGSPVLSVALPASLPAGTRGVGYTSTTLSASGGVPAYTWSATGVPAGMTLSAAGVLSGTPTTSGTATVAVTVTDATGATTTRSYLLDVADAPTITTPATLPTATVGAAYSPQTFAATGGTAPYTWSITGQPSGMSFSTAGILSGTPTSAATVTLTLTVTDALGRTGSATRALTVQAATDAHGCPNAPIGWKAEYFSNMTLTGAPTLCRDDATIDFDWADRAPATSLPRDYFSVRWTRSLWFDAGTYTFEKGSDDGMRVVVDGTTLIDDWVDHAYDGGRWSKNLAMTAGYHTIVVTMYERGGLARARFHVEQQVAATCPTSVIGWRGEYYRTRDLSGVTKLCRDDAAIDFDWSQSSPDPAIPADDFSVRWTKTATFEAGTYVFTKGSDDGMRVYIDGVALIDDWVDQSYDGPVTVTHAMTAGSHTVVVEFYERGGYARATFSWDKMTTATCPTTINGWKGEYFSNRTLSGTPTVCRDDASIAFNWGTAAPIAGMPSDDFSVRWTRTAYFRAGWYQFTVGSDDGMRVYYDGALVIDEWWDRSYTWSSSWSYVAAGWHTIVMQYYERGGDAQATLVW